MIINKYQSKWKLSCPCQIGKYNYYLSLYSLISKNDVSIFKNIFFALYHGKIHIKLKTIFLMFLFFFPLKIRKGIFVLKTNFFNR